jgi:dTDP-4-dehydrorhamnose 3,5-epimerase-like enzyme
MKVEHKKVNFKDERGIITDIFVNAPKDHAVVIFSKKGAVRGNHYHKKSVQSTFVVSGQLTMLTQKVGQKKIYRHILKPNDLMEHMPLEAHALLADKDTIFLAFIDGARGGKNYEKDTFRLKNRLDKK